MTTDISERGLEKSIERDMLAGGWKKSRPEDFDRHYAIDAVQLFGFLRETQPDEWQKLGIANPDSKDDIDRKKFLERINDELRTRGIIDVLRKPLNHNNTEFSLYYSLPSEDNEEAVANYAKNRFTLTRQLKFREESEHSLDLGMFINGLPVITAELKNNLTRQTVHDAVSQYRGRNAAEKLFAHGRCAVHFALDEYSVQMCTHLHGRDSVFLPFDKGNDDGAGNPINPKGISTDYLWKEILCPKLLSEIVEHYAKLLGQGNEKKQIWPRYHQLDAVRELLAQIKIGNRYLVQHSAGSGKSKTIAWLAHRLAEIQQGCNSVFDSVLVVSNRRVLDGQLQKDIRDFSGDPEFSAHAKTAADLRRMIEKGKKVIVTTVQKFPFIAASLRNQTGKQFAIIIDEAHAGQTGKAAAKMNAALGSEEGDAKVDPEDNGEDTVNAELEKLMNSRKMIENACYFAFTATPKAKTLELFGEPQTPTAEGKIRYIPHHNYWMKQAIEEKFILDVLASYTPVETAFHIIKTIANNPTFDAKRAQKKLRKYVETHPKNVDQKAKVMVEHFYDCRIDRNIDGQARAMVVCGSIKQALQYYFAISEYLQKMNKVDKVWVAFSGEHDYNGTEVTESKLNGFPENETADRFKEDKNARFLVCADKFQVGFDEPRLQVMYVDKPLSGIMAVQTLSRINRIHPQKDSCMVLDFCNSNSLETIQKAFQDYYQTTILGDKADPNKLHNIKSWLDSAGVYSASDVEKVVQLFLESNPRESLEPSLSACRDRYMQKEDVNEQIKFKGDAKSFCRAYEFIATVLPFNMPEWEKLSIFLNLLIPKLPSPNDKDLSRGILEAVDMESYRIRKLNERRIEMEEEDGEIKHTEEENPTNKREPEMETLELILQKFNAKFSVFFEDDADLKEAFDYLESKVIPMVKANEDYVNTLQNTPEEGKNVCDSAVREALLELEQEESEILIKLRRKDDEFWVLVREWVYDRTKSKTG